VNLGVIAIVISGGVVNGI